MQPMPMETSIKIHPRRPRHQLKGRQPSEEARAEVRALIGAPPANGHRRDLLIEHLHALNDHYRGLFERHLVALAAEMRLSMAEVFEVASFYHHFEVLKDDATPPRLTVRVCESLSCQMAGADALLAKLPALLGADVKVVPAPCIGRCEQAPAALVGQRGLGHATVEAIVSMSNRAVALSGQAPAAPETVVFDAYRQAGGYALAQAVACGERDAEGVIAALEHAGLRGLGGAGFPTGRKWRILRGFEGPRLMAVNIDEGEPGTFKDRYYLERDPHRFLEGVLIAAHVVGCDAVYLYLRDEYPECRAILTQAITELQRLPELRGRLPKIELRRVLHNTIKKVTDDIEQRFNFNTAISAMMELVNALYVYKEAQKNYNAGLVYETVSALLRLLAPFVPHVTEELWHGVIDADSSVHAQSWPKAEAEAMKVDNVEIVLQVNGKVKGRLVVPAEAGREELEKLALADEHIAAMVDVGKIVKIVCVPRRLVNIVARP